MSEGNPPSAGQAPSDLWGRDLEIEIRLTRDGRVHFHDIPLDLLPVLRTLCPDDPDLARRAAIAEAMRARAAEPPGPVNSADQERCP